VMSDFFSLPMVFVGFGVTLFTGLVSGSYPALVLSSFEPVKVLKKSKASRRESSWLRKGLVLVQMSISLILLIASVVIYSQIDYLKNKDLGLNKEQVVTIPLGIANQENRQIYRRLKTEIDKTAGIENVSAAFTHPTTFGTQAQDVRFEGRRLDEEMPVYVTSVDFDFIETLEIEVLRGRSFLEDRGSETGNLVINERMEDILGEGSALDKTLNIGGRYQGRIVGVVKDFHMESVSNAFIGPLIMFINPRINYIFLRIQPQGIAATLDRVERAWQKIAPHLPFTYSFLDEEFDRLYTDVENLGRILKYFTVIAGFIAFLGLFALSSFAAGKRTKEIGIRKVLGSSVGNILFLLNRDFIALIVLANVLAWPVARIMLGSWLKNFPYHVDLSWGPFLISGLLTIVVTLITVSTQTLKASLADPVDSLRYE
jgi:putative ABC transport system permease protein